MFFSLACGGETPSGPSRAYAPGFRMRKNKSPNPSRTRLSRILAQPNPFFSPSCSRSHPARTSGPCAGGRLLHGKSSTPFFYY